MLFSNIKRAFGMIDIKEGIDEVAIVGIPADILQQDIAKFWQTSRINAWMFKQIGRSFLILPKFFIPDFYYLLEQLSKDKSTRYRARTAVSELMGLIKEKTWYRETLTDHPDILNFSKLSELAWKADDYQIKFLQEYNRDVPKYQLTGMLLAAPPGTGKTFMGIALACALEADLVIVVCPQNAVNAVWAKTIRIQYGQDVSLWTSEQGLPVNPMTRWNVFHYESLAKAIELAKRAGAKKPVIILDESVNFNEEVAQRTQNFIELCKVLKCQHVLWMSGTPFKAVGTEAIPMLSTIDVRYFSDDAKMRFRKIFGSDKGRALEILGARVGRLMYIIDKREVVPLKPITKETKIRLNDGDRYTMPVISRDMVAFVTERMEFYRKNIRSYEATFEAGLAEYAKTIKGNRVAERDLATYRANVKELRYRFSPREQKDMMAWVKKFEEKTILPALSRETKKAFDDCRSVIKYVQLRVRGEALGRIVGQRRIECAVALAKAAPLTDLINKSEKKTVIFSTFTAAILAAADRCREADLQPELVYQETNKRFDEIERAFAEQPAINPLCATFKSLSSAVPLLSANRIVMLNRPFRAHEYEQTVSRIDRRGQDTQPYVDVMVLDTGSVPNISTNDKEILSWSAAQVNIILGLPEDDLEGQKIAEAYLDARDMTTQLIDLAKKVLRIFINL